MKREHILQQQSPLPSGYRQLEYIESTGTQYINTNIVPSNTHTKVTADIQFTTVTPNETKMPFGVDRSGRYFMLVLYSDSRFQMNCGISGSTLDLFVTTATTDRTTIMLEKNQNTYNVQGFGVSLSGTCGSISGITQPYNIYLFARRSDNKIPNKIAMKLYHCQMALNGNIVREYYPALRIADSKPGLYDLVNNQFYTNAGTGEFLYA